MEVMDVRGPEFKAYGRVIEGYDVSGLMKAMESTPLPEGVVYVASVPELEALSAAKELADGIYGQMKIQVGYCNGHNRKLNALEYHRDSEVNLAVKDLILLLGKQQDISEDFTYDTSKVKAFLVPAGTLIEVYATTLHYAPCEAGDEGFRCVVVLPQGTNMELDHRPVDRCGEEKLLAARNKWLIGHEEGGLDEGAWIGLTGENISLS
ncbi:DUF4867 family protein [Enterocloster citroniae]|uniref:DUF4867 family protein n=2 Tax=Enterocloster citroniae TaxID=358743 RepID=A0ABV2FZY2_9FIRM|nr:DUF4867 family protein [Enterocloster citroniae]KMW21050.1 hypothetical protein HMPREF9470_01894 [[Clostridium] citroniae WAL-19142]MCD8280415.1 DUF4867 family protein [Enterocloster citroniae]